MIFFGLSYRSRLEISIFSLYVDAYFHASIFDTDKYDASNYFLSKKTGPVDYVACIFARYACLDS